MDCNDGLEASIGILAEQDQFVVAFDSAESLFFRPDSWLLVGTCIMVWLVAKDLVLKRCSRAGEFTLFEPKLV
ncbi:MAG: hypothetical protein R3B47_00030 [Bacteroidia bacterium]